MLKAAVAVAARWLEQRAEAINALNVFPVPDGDTGLNMSLTLAAATEHALEAGENAGEVATALARGALMGSRGNSGVILARLLAGFATEVQDSPTITPVLFARALRAGANAAYESMEKPVEGTILTVARAAAEGAETAQGGSLLETLEAAHQAAARAVAQTPDLLPVLKQASVVDAGGEGYRVILEGLLFGLRGDELPPSERIVNAWADLTSLHQEDGDFYGYCTEVLFQGESLDPAAVRDRVARMGTSVLVVGDTSLIKVHVHTLQPGAVVDMATDLGELVKVKIDNMQLQNRDFVARARKAGQGGFAAPAGLATGTALVAVASGAGLCELLASLGVTIVSGGVTMNPSVEQIHRGILATDRTDVLILPNSKNVILAAREAAHLATDRHAEVLTTHNIAQGIAAALALNPEADVQINVANCARAAESAHCIAITTAARSATIEGLQVDAGEYLALLDEVPAGTGAGPLEALTAALARLSDSVELATIYVGESGTRAEAASLAGHLRESNHVECEIFQGGQPNYPFIISLE